MSYVCYKGSLTCVTKYAWTHSFYIAAPSRIAYDETKLLRQRHRFDKIVFVLTSAGIEPRQTQALKPLNQLT